MSSSRSSANRCRFAEAALLVRVQSVVYPWAHAHEFFTYGMVGSIRFLSTNTLHKQDFSGILSSSLWNYSERNAQSSESTEQGSKSRDSPSSVSSRSSTEGKRARALRSPMARALRSTKAWD